MSDTITINGRQEQYALQKPTGALRWFAPTSAVWSVQPSVARLQQQWIVERQHVNNERDVYYEWRDIPYQFGDAETAQAPTSPKASEG